MDPADVAINNYLREPPSPLGQFSLMQTSRIRVHPVISQLFPIRPDVLSAIQASMQNGCFSPAHPIVVGKGHWANGNVVVDGHTRLQAAKAAKLDQVPVVRISFDSEDAALDYAISSQRNRRNMTDADILHCVAVLDEKRKRGGDRKSEDAKSKAPDGAIDPKPAKSSEETAKLLGTSARKVERVRTVLKHADEETKAAVESGEKSINKAYEETQRCRRKENAPNEESIVISEAIKPSSEESVKTGEASRLSEEKNPEEIMPGQLSFDEIVLQQPPKRSSNEEPFYETKPKITYQIPHDFVKASKILLEYFSRAECIGIATKLARHHGLFVVERNLA